MDGKFFIVFVVVIRMRRWLLNVLGRGGWILIGEGVL